MERYQKVSKVMAWRAISVKRKLPLLFIDQGFKIDSNYYIENVLEGYLLPHAQKLYETEYFCFQQDSSLTHQANPTQEWCNQNLSDFISSKELLAASVDLNTLDFCVWGYMLSKIGVTKGLTSLKIG